MEFNILIENCEFKRHIGNLMFLSKARIPMPIIPPPFIDGNNTFGNSTLFGNDTLNGNMTSYMSMPIDILYDASVIIVEGSIFKDCMEVPDNPAGTGLMFTIRGLELVCISITDSLFDNNEANLGTTVLFADYAPIINIIKSNFTNNFAKSKGLFHIKMEDTMIDISESRFEKNGWYRRPPNDYASAVSIISADKNAYVSLNIMESTFSHNTNGKYGCFDLYSGDINIIDS
eukprot:509300_1